MNRETIFSPCRKYRYTLWRQWDGDLFPDVAITRPTEYVQFIALNPSIADETQDDPTVRRCIDFAKRWGFGAMCMTNAFAFRSTDPQVMIAQEKTDFDGYGKTWNENIHWIGEISIRAGLVIVAWGKTGTLLQMDQLVMAKLVANSIQANCLRKNDDGTPAHPLYLPSHLTPIPYP